MSTIVSESKPQPCREDDTVTLFLKVMREKTSDRVVTGRTGIKGIYTVLSGREPDPPTKFTRGAE